MSEEIDDTKIMKKELHLKFPFLPQVTDEELVNQIKLFKAKLYDVQKAEKHYLNMIEMYEKEIMFRPVNPNTHYMDSMDRYRIDKN